jgi:hypothetical protein
LASSSSGEDINSQLYFSSKYFSWLCAPFKKNFAIIYLILIQISPRLQLKLAWKLKKNVLGDKN